MQADTFAGTYLGVERGCLHGRDVDLIELNEGDAYVQAALGEALTKDVPESMTASRVPVGLPLPYEKPELCEGVVYSHDLG